MLIYECTTQMTATEQWIFLCAAHKTPKECPAIGVNEDIFNYFLCIWVSSSLWLHHIPDPRLHSTHIGWGSVLAQQQQVFSQQGLHQGDQSSRLWGSNSMTCQRPPKSCSSNCWRLSPSTQESSVAKLGSVCRRVYRIFSHAYFHHR